MSRVEMAGRDTDFQSRITFEHPNARILGGLIGNTTPVASETSFTADSPNSPIGAQPAEDAPLSDTWLFDEVATTYPGIELPYDKESPLVASPRIKTTAEELDEIAQGGQKIPSPTGGVLWRSHILHVPTSPDIFRTRSGERLYIEPTPRQGEIVAKTIEGTLPGNGDTAELPIAEQPIIEDSAVDNKPLWRRVKWYNPADVARYVGVKLRRPEAITTSIGNMAMIGVLGAVAYQAVRHGGAQTLWVDSTPHATDVPLHHGHQLPDATTRIGDAPHHATTPITPESHHPAPQPEHAHHYRTAVSEDPATHRASSVEDWSKQALERAGKQAGLSDSQISALVHNRHDISQVNHAFYTQNKSVGADPHHYLYLDKPKYQIDNQQAAAKTIVDAFRAEHGMQSAVPDTPPATGAEVADRASKALNDQELSAILKDLNMPPNDVESVTTAPVPQLQHEVFAGFTKQELINISTAIGTIATIEASMVGTRALRGAYLARSMAPEKNGDVVIHREVPFRQKPTIPNFTTPRQYYKRIDRDYLEAQQLQAAQA